MVAALPLTAIATNSYSGGAAAKYYSNTVSVENLQKNEALMFKAEVLRLTNIEREKVGVAPLQGLEELEELAQIRAEEIKTMLSHTRPCGNDWFTIFDNSSLTYKKAGENLAFGFKRPSDLVDAWMNSAGHSANILNPDFELLGIGFYKDAGDNIHVSQLFFEAMPTPPLKL